MCGLSPQILRASASSQHSTSGDSVPFYSFLDDPNLIGGPLNQVESNGEGFVDVLSIERDPTFSFKQRFIQSHSYTRMVTVVV